MLNDIRHDTGWYCNLTPPCRLQTLLGRRREVWVWLIPLSGERDCDSDASAKKQGERAIACARRFQDILSLGRRARVMGTDKERTVA